jgi:hypothetical protein
MLLAGDADLRLHARAEHIAEADEAAAAADAFFGRSARDRSSAYRASLNAGHAAASTPAPRSAATPSAVHSGVADLRGRSRDCGR